MSRLALDMDSTLAASMNTVFDHIDADATYADVETWDWPIEQFGADAFLGGFDTVWTEKWEQIEPLEDDVATVIETFAAHYGVDIVTAQPDHEGVTEGKAKWLEAYDIPHDRLVTVPRDESKADLDYDVYVDDKPALPSRVDDAVVYLYDQPYNRDADGIYKRVETLEDALDWEIDRRAQPV